MIDETTIKSAAIDKLQELRQSVEVSPAVRRFWERILNPGQRQELGGFDTAFQSTGPIGIWMKLRRISAEQAVMDLAIRLNLTDRATTEWILRELDQPDIPPEASDVPSWNKESRQLMFRGQVVRQVARPTQARNLVAILDAFEEQGWPPRIDDPLPRGRDTKRLQSAIETFNEKCQMIRLHADGTGQGISWSVR